MNRFLLLALVCCLPFSQLHSALNAYLKVPTAGGESATPGFEGEIEVLDLNWGINRSVGESGSSFTDLVVTKTVDKATPHLMMACAAGNHLPDSVLTLTRSAGGPRVNYMIITMKQARVTSISVNGSGGEDRLTENVSFNFAEVEVVYNQYDDSDGSLKDSVEMTWNVQTQTP